MEIKDLISVVEAYRLQSFSDAADHLSYTPSAVSKHIKRVEAELGFPIFVRGDKLHQVCLTAQGRAVMPLIQEMVDRHADLMSLSRSLRTREEGGLLRVGYPHLVGTFGEVDIMSAFSEENPGVSVEYTRGTGRALVEMVAAGKLDAAFLFIVGEFDPHLYCKKENLTGLDISLCNTVKGMYIGLAENSPLAQKEEITLGEIINLPIAVWKNPNEEDPDTDHPEGSLLPTYRSMRYYLQYCEKHGCPPKVRYFDAISHNAFHLAANGEVGIPVMRVGFTYEGVRFVRVSDWENTGNLYFVTRQSNHSPQMQKLRVCVARYAEVHASEQ